MPQQQQPQQSGSEGSSLDFLWMIVLIIGIVLAAWYFGKVYITQGVFYLKLGEIYLINLVMHAYASVGSFVGLPRPDFIDLKQLILFIHQHTGAVDFPTLVKISSEVGSYMRYPFSFILIVFAALLYFGSASLRFKKTFTMERLKNQEKVNWPRVMPVANLKLVKTDLDEMPWAMAHNPLRFCKYHNILKEDVKYGKPVLSIERGPAHDIFALQLGPMWRGPAALPRHIIALLAIFSARIDSDVDAADALLDQIGASSASGKLDFSGAEQLLAKHLNYKPVVKVLSRHAYVRTVMASMLDLARGAGVLAAADFIWLKPIDRKLWYMLNCVGRQTAFAEVAGVFAHWLAEKKLGMPLTVPMVDAAVDGLELAMKDILHDKEEDE